MHNSWWDTPCTENNYSSVSSRKTWSTNVNRNTSIEFCKNWAKSQDCECHCCCGYQYTLSYWIYKTDKNLLLTSNSNTSITHNVQIKPLEKAIKWDTVLMFCLQTEKHFIFSEFQRIMVRNCWHTKATIKKYEAERKIRRIIDWLLQFKYFSHLRITAKLHSCSLCQWMHRKNRTSDFSEFFWHYFLQKESGFKNHWPVMPLRI